MQDVGDLNIDVAEAGGVVELLQNGWNIRSVINFLMFLNWND